MPILTVKHVTTYHYKQPVAFGEHRMMLRPRDDKDQTVLETDIRITPEPTQLSWARDSFGNHVATARFSGRARELRFESTIRLDHAPAEFSADDIEGFAGIYPFAYATADRAGLAPYLAPVSDNPAIARWAAGFLDENGRAKTGDLLVQMTQSIKRQFKHAARHEKGIQDPVETLTMESGSCRDVAMLMIAGLRSLGIAARFVSGYLHLADDTDDDLTGGNTHAWGQAFVPGPGWIDFDASSGRVGSRNLVRVAVVHDPREAIPLQGSWIGKASDHVAMKVAVKVRAAEAATD